MCIVKSFIRKIILDGCGLVVMDYVYFGCIKFVFLSIWDLDICEKVKSGCVLIVSWIVNNLVDVNIKLKIMLVFNSDFCFRIEYFFIIYYWYL